MILGRIRNLRRLRVLLISLTIVAAAVTPARAASSPPGLPSEKAAWIQVRSAHFTFYSNASEKQTRKIVTSLERFRAMLSVFHAQFAVDPPRPTLIYVFKTEEEYAPYKRDLETRPGKVRVGGYFLPREEANYVTLEAIWGEDASRIVFHEFLHQFISVNLPHVPLWFNEGMAEYYSTFRGDEDSAKVGLPLAGHLAWLSQNPLIPLRDLFRLDHDSPEYKDGDRAGTFYAESWALVHYLLNGPAQRRQQVGPFLDSLLDGTPLDDAFRASFQTGYDGLEGELRTYVRGRAFGYANVDFAEGLKVDTAVQVTPMERDEALSRLGDLLAHLGPERSEDAIRHCRAALQINPKSAPAEAGIGFAEASRGNYEAAAAHYQTAAELDPGNHLYPYLRAVSLLGKLPGGRIVGSAGAGIAPEDLEKVRDLLQRTIERRPDFAEAYVDLGATYVGAEGTVDAGIAALEKARSLLPSRMDVVANLAALYLQKGDREQAGNLVENVLERSGDSTMTRWARLALENYDAVHAPANVTPDGPALEERKAGFEERKRRTVEFLEKLLEEATDPQARKVLEERLRLARESVDYPGQVEAFNQAVDRANHKDYQGAMGILEKILPEIRDEELEQRTRELLERLKEDAKRFGKPSK